MELRKVHETVVVHGNYEYGIRNKGRAYTLLSVCQRRAGENAIYEMRERQADGCLIIAVKTGIMLRAIIVTPPIPQQEKKKIPQVGGAEFVIIVGTELDGYCVGRIPFDGDGASFEILETFDQITRKYRPVEQEDIYINKIMLDNSDELTIGINTISESSWDAECNIPNPHCPLAPLSGTIECAFSMDVRNIQENVPEQNATFRFHRRQYCDRRFGLSAYFRDKQDFIQLTDNASFDIGHGPAILIPRVEDADQSEIKSSHLSISCLNFEKRFYCTSEWGDSYERELDDFLSADQCYFSFAGALAGPMVIDPGYSTIETGDYLDGEYKFREDTSEAYFVPWEHPDLAPFLDLEQRRFLYAWNRPLPGISARVFNTPLRMAYLGTGAPDFNKPAPAHEFFFNRQHKDVQVFISTSSLMEGTFDKLGAVGSYTITDRRHRVFSSAAVLFTGETLESTAGRNEKFRLALENFFFLVRDAQTKAALPVDENMSLSGNVYGYLSSPLATTSREDLRMNLYLRINAAREEEELEPLTPDNDLEFAAMIMAYDCAKNELESHTGSDGSSPSDRMLRTSYAKRFSLLCEVGENIAFGQKTVEEAFDAWRTSSTHWANITNPDWTDTGIAIYPTEDGDYYWVQVFGRRE